MASWKRLAVGVVLMILACLAVHDVEGLNGSGGGHGGKRGGKGGSSSSQSSYRSVESSRSGGNNLYLTRSRYQGPRYIPPYWGTAKAVGYLYGITSYKHRRLYREKPSKEPEVCFNERDLKNGTYGYFICPMPGEPDDKAYCCGDDDAQHCCKYYDNPAHVNFIIIFGVLIACVAVAVGVCCYCVRRRKIRNRGKSRNNRSKSTSDDIPLPTTETTNSVGVHEPRDTTERLLEPKQVGMSFAGYDTDANSSLPYSAKPAALKSPLPPGDSDPEPDSSSPGVGVKHRDPSGAKAPNYSPATVQPYPSYYLVN